MKRFIAILLLLCANLILLVHSVVPHHHHNGVMVSLQVESKHEHDDDNEHHHHNADSHESHDHQGEPNSENCLLSNLLSRFVINDKEDNDVFSAYIHLAPWFALYPDFSDQKVILEGKCIKHRPYLLSRYAVPDITSNGLRGPPSC